MANTTALTGAQRSWSAQGPPDLAALNWALPGRTQLAWSTGPSSASMTSNRDSSDPVYR